MAREAYRQDVSLTVEKHMGQHDCCLNDLGMVQGWYKVGRSLVMCMTRYLAWEKLHAMEASKASWLPVVNNG